MSNESTAAQIARLREMGKERAVKMAEMEEDECQFNVGSRSHARFVEEKFQTADEFAALTAAADALEREAWCEEEKAAVNWSKNHLEWIVTWTSKKYGALVSRGADRATAIYKAMGGGE